MPLPSCSVTDGAVTEHTASAVVSSMPLSALVKALDPPPPAEVLAAADDLHYRDHLTVALVVPEMASFPDNWVYVHDPTVRMGRIQNFGRWSPYMVKDGRTCLGLEYFVFEGDEIWSMADDDLVQMGKREIGTLGLVDPATVEAGYVVRMPKAYPYYDADYKRNVETLRRWLEANVANVCPVGRNGMHRYNNQDHSMYTAMLAVENLMGASHDVWSVNVEEEYHEEMKTAAGVGAPQSAAARGSGRAAPVLPKERGGSGVSNKVWFCPRCGYEVNSRGRCHGCGERLIASPLPELDSGPDDEEVGYRLDLWDDETRGRLIQVLISAGVRHRFEEEELVILAANEARVDRIVAQVTGALGDDEDEDEDEQAAGVTGENVARDLYDAAKVLREDPTDMQADVALGESSAAVFAVDSLPGLDEDQLAAVGRVTRRLLGALGADEALEDEIRHQAEVLCRLLAPGAGEAQAEAELERARARLGAGAKEKGRLVSPAPDRGHSGRGDGRGQARGRAR